MSEYLPLYGERLIGRCDTCGHWRGEHHGQSANDDEMQCPSDTTFQRREVAS